MPFSRSVKPKAWHDEGEMARKLSEKEKDELATNLITELKPAIVSIVERAFRRYCSKHNASMDMEELEWKRFKKILNGML